MSAYVHYMQVMSKYHDMEIGKHLVNEVKDKHEDYLRIVFVGMMMRWAFMKMLEI